MTTEQKAIAYDEAIRKAKIALDCCDSASIVIKNTVFDIFPKLVESEDEKIRKELIFYLGDMPEDTELRNGLTNRDVLVWLEKQGGIDNCPLECSTNTVMTDSKKNQVKKFKIGDWLVENEPNNYARFIQILEVVNVYEKERYRISRDIHNDEDVVECRFIENNYHSFTIQDAKDGDILIDKSNSRECPFIFKETKPSDIKTDMLNPLTVLGYCGIGGAGFTKGSGWGDTANCIYYPATKEQRDQLEKAMADAGYTFDFDKKELRKIDQNPAWSEEDENRINRLIAYFEDKESFTAEDDIVYANWLKLLKARVQPQPKQEWSEDDDQYLLVCKNALRIYQASDKWDAGIISRWLENKLKAPQLQWKPSEEQIEALESATENCAYSEYQDCLRELITQLKKLKG